jgi:outer membrane lipoprotein-sorting protein
VALTGDMEKIAVARKQLKSYQVTTSGGTGFNGQPMSMVSEVKLADGKPVRTKMITRDGYRLTMMDQHVSYNVNPQAKTAMRMTMPAPGAGPGGPPGGGRGGAPGGAPGGARGAGPGGAPGGPAGGPPGGGRGGGRGGRGGRSFDPAEVARFNPTTSSTKLGGLDCWLVEWKNEGGDQMKVWVDKQYGLARQSVTSGGTITFTYSKINAIPDSEFELPSGLKVTDAPAGGRGGFGGGGRRQGGGGQAPAGGGGGSA